MGVSLASCLSYADGSRAHIAVAVLVVASVCVVGVEEKFDVCCRVRTDSLGTLSNGMS